MDELNDFLREVFDAYVEKHKPQEKHAEVAKALEEAKARVAQLEAELATSGATEDEIKQFLIDAEKMLAGHATEVALMTMLVTRFGGKEEKKQRKPRKKKDEPPITDKEKAFLKQVMTEEAMSAKEIATQLSQHANEEWRVGDIRPILKACIDDKSVLTEGEGRGMRYKLANAADVCDEG